MAIGNGAGLLTTFKARPNCAGGNCAVPVHVLPSMPTQFGPLTIQNQNPLGHLRTIDFQRAPHVSITRVHGLAPTATLSDAPSGFTGGCHPSSTTYCRQGGNFAAPVNVPAPVFSAYRHQQLSATQLPLSRSLIQAAPLLSLSSSLVQAQRQTSVWFAKILAFKTHLLFKIRD